MKKKKLIVKTVLSICLAIFSLAMFFPFYLMVITSLKTMGEIQAPFFTFIPKKFMFSNYIEAIMRGNWIRFFSNSFIVTSITVVLSLLFNSMAGYAFSRLHFPGRDKLFFILLLGLMVPGQVTLVPLFIIMKHFPLCGGNNIFGQGGTGLIDTYAGLIIPFIANPFGIFLCRQFFMNFPKSLDDAAQIDGASKLRIYFNLYIHLGKPILATLTVFKSVHTWNDYLWPLITTNSENMRTVQLALTMFRNETNIEWNLLMAATTFVMMPLVILFLFGQKYFVESIVVSGIKA